MGWRTGWPDGISTRESSAGSPGFSLWCAFRKPHDPADIGNGSLGPRAAVPSPATAPSGMGRALRNGGLCGDTPLESDYLLPGFGRDLQPAMRALGSGTSAARGKCRRGPPAAVLFSAMAVGQDRRRVTRLDAAAAVHHLRAGASPRVDLFPAARTYAARENHRFGAAGH